MALAVCSKCGRSFNIESLNVHERICRGRNSHHRKSTSNITEMTMTENSMSENKINEIANVTHIPQSKFVVCNSCGKTFTIHSIDKHKPVCERKMEIERRDMEAQRRHEEGPKGVGRLPGVVCYICGRNFGTTSIDIHEKQCLEKFNKENNELPKNQRRSMPIKPQSNKEVLEQMVKEQKLAGNVGYNVQAAMNDINAAAFNENLVPCPNCARTFNPDALKFHIKACSRKKPARRVGEVTLNN